MSKMKNSLKKSGTLKRPQEVCHLWNFVSRFHFAFTCLTLVRIEVGLLNCAIPANFMLHTWLSGCRLKTRSRWYKNIENEAKTSKYYDYLTFLYLWIQINDKANNMRLISIDNKGSISIFLLVLFIQSFHFLNIAMMHLIYLFCIRLLVTFVDLITFEASAYQCMHFHSWWEQYTVFVPVDGTWHLYFIKQKSYVK